MQPFPSGTVRQLLASPSVTPVTRRALLERMATPPVRKFFTEAQFATLQAVCARLIPQPERETPLDLAAYIDLRLSAGQTDGWRYEALPPDGEAYQTGLRGLDESATIAFGQPFQRLSDSEQDTLLDAVQRGKAAGEIWKTLPGIRFFEDLLTEAVEVYFSHPLAQEEIGYVGFADAAGWQSVSIL